MKFLDAADQLRVTPESTWIVDKAQLRITQLEDMLEKSRASNAAATIDHEQLFHQHETRFIQLQKEHDLACQDRDRLRVTLESATASKASSASTEQAATEHIAALQTEMRQRESKIIMLEEETKANAERAERQQVRLDKQDNELASQSQQLIAKSQQELELTRQLDEAQRQSVPTRLENNRLKNETETLSKEKVWLESQLDEKTTGMLELQKKSSSREFELQSENDRIETERSSLEERLRSEKKRTMELGEKISQVSTELMESRRDASSREEHFVTELEASNKVAALYKAGQEESQASLMELEGRLIETRKLTEEARAKHGIEETKHARVVDELRKKVAVLEEAQEGGSGSGSGKGGEGSEGRGSGSNDGSAAASSSSSSSLPIGATAMERAMAKLAPTAATISAIKSGMSVTEMYTSLVERDNALRESKLENVRINT